MQLHQQNILQKGYAIIDDIYTSEEIKNIIYIINETDTDKRNFRKTADLFAIRRFLNEIPAVQKLIFTTKLVSLIKELMGNDFFVTKSIYFDKPEQSNWFVAYHQDLTISVDKRTDTTGYGPWTVKQEQFAVQPPLSILESNFTIRIHLDDTDENNGALKVIPGSHQKGVYRPETINWEKETEDVCVVSKGGVMLMRPLLLHSSGRSTNQHQRRVIHIEFSNQQLPEELQWAERLVIDRLINTDSI